MIPRIAEINDTQQHYLDFINTLKSRGFEGDLSADYANRVVLSTDNSIYQILPQGVLYPRGIEDLVRIASLSNEPAFRDIVLSPRGGGTGTNGQSLSDGLLVDISRHMNQILEINAEERWARVQTGVVKDQLNAALKPYGLFFAPELSTSNRATIGGMINTDASGQGSCLYGKTRDHVLALKSVLLDGSVLESTPLSAGEYEAQVAGNSLASTLCQQVNDLHQDNLELIAERFPALNRCLTGYDLAHVRTEAGLFDLNSILCGSEGTLALIAEAKLNLLSIPKCAALVNLCYESFNDALRDAQQLMGAQPTSIETVDSRVLGLAMEDIVWESVSEFFPSQPGRTVQGINLVEYTADSEQELQQKVKVLEERLAEVMGQPGKAFSYTLAWGQEATKRIWAMRKKSVGLLGNTEGEKRPIPFVEDTAVPPENLADFIIEFRELLDQRNLQYGMFGHVDAGVLHVRPAIDMKDPQQERLIREVTDGVVALTRKYKGLLWGEHGKGLRSEYAPELFGPELYRVMRKIKGAFDPRNQLNPGKICTPIGVDAELIRIDEAPTRGQYDRQIDSPAREQFSAAMYCNGNGACYNYDPNDAMCPSWKGTRDRTQSPKGRASLIREWVRLMQQRKVDLPVQARQQRSGGFMRSLPARTLNTLAKRRGEYDFSHEVHDTMMGCLACKSCVGQCPIKVNVPQFRSRFLELYYGRYLRPLKDYFVGALEFMIPALSRFPAPYNWAMSNSLMQGLMKKTTGMVDSPAICTHSLRLGLKDRGKSFATLERLAGLDEQTRQRTVVLVQDAFTSYFETPLVLDLLDLLSELGFNVEVAPFFPNGKPLHVHGFLGTFEKVARDSARTLNGIEGLGLPLVGVDPSMTLTYRQEYAEIMDRWPHVQLLQEWLADQHEQLAAQQPVHRGRFKLMAHCSERTSAAPSIKAWQTVFTALGQELDILALGCCGMAGTYGHEANNVATSKAIYAQSWKQAVEAHPAEQLLVTGYSCRSQVKRTDQVQLLHPAQALLALLRH
ncbi:D-2-hydroxyglutarate dehydrogenase YdiJ [Aestuariirhabdus litorea]|uniref:D-2-hydroxyglutarate dehydrogenase n=1 Tax=Aestuariirhabdus litorea TaxID=2528527 RepID=A0A3P3VP67_9GAMM|nr:FAD-binding and (Fe-S)-binding domain-containing protein [Aestuariirhabdus litorea]RRJ84542.1 FAD-binding oxidoreductase [Aestuariirhabdus litorea]RWW97768.1 FAD-binding protein [Endozoicomonadaceae bacterium GTF-13]